MNTLNNNIVANPLFAAIDIGSNAGRLLFSRVYETKDNKIITEKTSLIRVPLRLGEDSFSKSYISEEKEKNLINSFKAFKYLFEVYKPVSYIACATSALREAINGDKIIYNIRKETGIKVNIIDGLIEAEIICASHSIDEGNPQQAYLYIDVGGGSTELSVIYENKLQIAESFKVGTVRLLNNEVKESAWKEMKNFLKDINEKYPNIVCVGSGGNINKLSKLFSPKGSRKLSIHSLSRGISELSAMTLEQRIALGLRMDRADVIVPAGQIFQFILHNLHCKSIDIPRIGLADGLIKILYYKYKQDKIPENKKFLYPDIFK